MSIIRSEQRGPPLIPVVERRPCQWMSTSRILISTHDDLIPPRKAWMHPVMSLKLQELTVVVFAPVLAHERNDELIFQTFLGRFWLLPNSKWLDSVIPTNQALYFASRMNFAVRPTLILRLPPRIIAVSSPCHYSSMFLLRRRRLGS